MTHLVTFTSSQFDVSAETANPINPIVGESVLNWLGEKLRGAEYDDPVSLCIEAFIRESGEARDVRIVKSA